ALPAAAARPVAELPAAQVPGAAVGPNAGDHAAGGADRGGSRHAGRPPPGGLRPRHRRPRRALRRDRLPLPGPAPGRAPRAGAAARAAGLADRHAFGIRPAVKGWRPGTAALTFSVGTGLLIQGPGVLPVTGQLALTAGYPASALPLPAIATRAFFGTANAHPGQ